MTIKNACQSELCGAGLEQEVGVISQGRIKNNTCYQQVTGKLIFLRNFLIFSFDPYLASYISFVEK